jgi:hypothetical protein
LAKRVIAVLWRNLAKNYRLAVEAALVVAVIVGLRAVLFAVGVQGISATSLASSIIAAAVFVMALVLAGVLGDYRDAERAPSDLAAGLYAILRETESMHRVWGKPDLGRMRARLIEVVDALRRDIDPAGPGTARPRSKICRNRCWNWRTPTSRPTTSSGCAPSRPGCARRCCGSTRSSGRSSCPRPTP